MPYLQDYLRQLFGIMITGSLALIDTVSAERRGLETIVTILNCIILYLHYKSFVTYNMSTALLLLIVLHNRDNNICMVYDSINILDEVLW